MRIIAGTWRSRTLEAPPGLATRPTTDRLRETLFNVLAPRIEGAHFLDLYAGSGAVGIEAMSRGAARVVFVERAVPALNVLRANLARLGLKQGVVVESRTAKSFLGHEVGQPGFNIVFLDPPYDAANEYEIALGSLGGEACGLLRKGAVVIAEHRRKEELPEAVGVLERTRLLRQGDAALSFYVVCEPKPIPQDSQTEFKEENA
jgi:16S rRNA (guanine(966)-N(2))-methyltransferase RsmD